MPLEEQPSSEGFICTKWMKDTLEEIEGLELGVKKEFILPKDVNHLFFISELGRPIRSFELGGLYNPSTRSMILTRGPKAQERGLRDPGVEFMPPRRDSEGKSEDIFFHTHTWNPDGPIQYIKDPSKTCRPSNNDIDKTLTVRMIEEEAGEDKTIISIISSGGFLSITEAKGAKLDEDRLRKSGISDEQLLKIKSLLALAPPSWIVNFAKDKTSEEKLVIAAKRLYDLKREDTTSSFSEKLALFRNQAADLTKEVMKRGERFLGIDLLIEKLNVHFPKYPTHSYLKNIGFSEDQIALLQSMVGLETSVFKVEEGVGITEIADSGS